MNWNKIGGKKEPKFDTSYLLRGPSGSEVIDGNHYWMGILSGIKFVDGEKVFLFFDQLTEREFQATHFCEIKPPKD